MTTFVLRHVDLNFSVLLYGRTAWPSKEDIMTVLRRHGVWSLDASLASVTVDPKFDFGAGRTYRRGVYVDEETKRQERRLSALWRDGENAVRAKNREAERRRKLDRVLSGAAGAHALGAPDQRGSQAVDARDSAGVPERRADVDRDANNGELT